MPFVHEDIEFRQLVEAAALRSAALGAAHGAIAPMFWGPRIGLDEACTTIREWIAAQIPGT